MEEEKKESREIKNEKKRKDKKRKEKRESIRNVYISFFDAKYICTHRIFTVAFNSIHCFSFIGRSNFGPQHITEWCRFNVCIYLYSEAQHKQPNYIRVYHYTVRTGCALGSIRADGRAGARTSHNHDRETNNSSISHSTYIIFVYF